MECDIWVIGGGPGGYVAAIRAAQNGKKVILSEKNLLGGTCLNVGCIPTKALLACADVHRTVRRASEFGIRLEGTALADWGAMQNRKTETVSKLRQGIAGLLKAHNVTVLEGSARLTGPKTGIAGEEKIEAESIILATGSLPVHPGFIPHHERIVDSTALLALEKLPRRLLILGGGVIGCEFAGLFAELGVEVTVVEMLPSLLPMFDKEIGRTLGMSFKKAGIRLFTGMALSDIQADEKGVSGKIGDQSVEADLLLVAIGRAPNSAELGFETVGVATDSKGWVPVNDRCQTTLPHIYAIGDITGKWQLAHAASAMGLVAVDSILGGDDRFDPHAIPGCVFTHPEIGTVGLSVEQAAERGITVGVGKFPFAAIGKAMALGETEGFCKIITDMATDKVLGVHIIGPHASDLISEAALAMSRGATAREIGNAIHPHPTLGEIMMESAHAVHSESVHQLPPRKR